MCAAPPPFFSRIEANQEQQHGPLPVRALASLQPRRARRPAPRPLLNDRLQAAAAAAMPGGRRDVLGVRIAPGLLRFGAALPGRRYRAALSIRNLRAGSCRLRLLPPRRPQVRGAGGERSGRGGLPASQHPRCRPPAAGAVPGGEGRAAGGPAQGPLCCSGAPLREAGPSPEACRCA